MKTYTIAKDLLRLFEEKLKKFSKKFERYGSYTYNKLDEFVCDNRNDRRYGYTLINVEVDAFYKVGDYEFVASLEWVDEVQENLIKKVSEDVFVPSEYKTRIECDHCKTDRPRKYTVLLKNKESGEYIQVGKSCVRDFIGVDLGNYMAYLSFFDNIEDFIIQHETSGIVRGSKHYTVDDVLGQAIEEVKRNGYISKSLSAERGCDSTSSRVYLALVEARNTEGAIIYNKYKITDDTTNTIAEVKKFFLDTPDEFKSYMESDYISNIKTLLQTEWIGVDKIGIVVSSVGTKLRIENERKEKASRPESNYVGNIGERITINNVKPTCMFSSYSEFGFMYIYKIVDNMGNEFVWKTSKDIDPDATINVIATVKNHSEYRGVKQTEITRARTSMVA